MLKEVNFSIPGWASVKFAPNDAEQRAAWALYVELSTRVASQPFDIATGRLRAALDSLYSIFAFTRSILRDAGPEVAHGPASFGPLAIGFLTEVLAPFLNRWHQPLARYEATCPAGNCDFAHERAWQDFDVAVDDLCRLQRKVVAYRAALGEISGAD